ncbi:hypothetical protein CONLIGDRAFT_143284 [Coniochaeta ligniaria NRRL 30616]|uniref:Uncharacterized protein n=1 Tax=Coniochaeta ligniaria NRRL 30616 TaxID=1408157 RepID=A0A1J7IZW0_9PEZI|nr:hypothetical protein CONLIGDRAFT_143284 [Coniochaeta ligniaria NRRL 30616]
MHCRNPRECLKASGKAAWSLSSSSCTSLELALAVLLMPIEPKPLVMADWLIFDIFPVVFVNSKEVLDTSAHAYLCLGHECTLQAFASLGRGHYALHPRKPRKCLKASITRQIRLSPLPLGVLPFPLAYPSGLLLQSFQCWLIGPTPVVIATSARFSSVPVLSSAIPKEVWHASVRAYRWQAYIKGD